MKRKRVQSFILIIAAFLLVTIVAYAQDGFDLSWSTVDGGGTHFSTGGDYSMGGTIGQPDAGVLSGGDYTLSGGFWSGGSMGATQHNIYLPLVGQEH